MASELTRRQAEVLRAVCRHGAEEASRNVLFIEPITTRDHLNTIFRKLGIAGSAATGKIGQACYRLGRAEVHR